MNDPVGRTAAQPFQITVDDADVAALRTRLTGTRWPTAIPAAGWSAGTPLDAMDRLVRHWATAFDWRAQEARLNALPQFTAVVDGRILHFVHFRSEKPGALPLILTHGWPSSFVELLPLAERLADEFDVVVPSLPGFGFSDERDAATPFMDTHDLWHRLMTDVLGYERYGAHGGDLGANVTTRLGAFHPDAVVGIHLLAVAGPASVDDGDLDDDEREYLASIETWEADEGAYEHQQSTKPATLAFGLADSPAGLLAWLLEKYRAWSEDPAAFSSDDILTQASLYWFTGTIASSFRPYYETRAYPRGPVPRVEVPTAVAVFPHDLALPPRRWAERRYEVTRYTRMPRGGHFAAHEQPDLLASDVRAFFTPLQVAERPLSTEREEETDGMDSGSFELAVGDGYALVLRDASTVDEMLALTLANLDRLAEWEDWARSPQTRASVAAYTDYLVQGFAAGMQLPLAIRCGAALVGSVGVRFDDSRRTAEIGYWIAREHEGRGVVTRSVRALVDWLLSEHETERIELRCARTNGRSRAVAERLGFTVDEGGAVDAAPPPSTEPRHDLVTYRFG